MGTTTTPDTGTVFRASTWVWASQLGLAVVYAALAVHWLGAGTVSWRTWIGIVFVVAAGWTAAHATWFARLQVRMTDDGVVVGAFRRRSYAWRDIRAVDLERRFWMTHRVVTITPDDGEPVTALAKGGWLDDAFDRHHRGLEARWRERTGSDAAAV